MSTLKTNTLSNVAGTQSIGVDRVAQGTAAAWVNFNGTGTVAIRDEYNVSSITDNGTGNYTVNFTTAMPDANYSVALSGVRNATNSDFNPTLAQGGTYSTSAVQIIAKLSASYVLEDSPIVNCIVFR